MSRTLSSRLLTAASIAFVVASLLHGMDHLTRDQAILVEAGCMIVAGVALVAIAWPMPGWYGRFARVLGSAMTACALVVAIDLYAGWTG